MTEHFKFSLFRGSDLLAQGVVFSSGKVALARLTGDHAIAVHDSMSAVCDAYCRDGETQVVWGYSEMAHYRHLLPSLETSPWHPMPLPADNPVASELPI